MDKKKVLIADNDEKVRKQLKALLKPLGLEINEVEDGKEALKKVKEEDFDLVLLELNLPEPGGMEILKEISEDRPDIKVIIITAHGSVETAKEAIRKGAVDYIEKPLEEAKTRGLISEVMDTEMTEKKLKEDYSELFKQTKKSINDKDLDAAVEQARTAVSLIPSRPEAYNLLGVAYELKGNYSEARNQYRASLSQEPSYKPAKDNLSRVTGMEKSNREIKIGDLKEED